MTCQITPEDASGALALLAAIPPERLPCGAVETLTIYLEQVARADTLQRENAYQARVAEWMMKCFGADITNSLQERCFRFFEEAGELCQALGMTEDQARDLVAYTWSRPAGEPQQEVGGVMVTLAAMCHAARLDMAAEGETELARIDQPEVIDKIRRKHHAKPLRTPHSALPAQMP